jgi:hypothetical protein
MYGEGDQTNNNEVTRSEQVRVYEPWHGSGLSQ